jgi:hypothetical protein
MRYLHYYHETRKHILKHLVQWYRSLSKSKRAMLGCAVLIGIFALYGLGSAAQQSFAAKQNQRLPVGIPTFAVTPTPALTPMATLTPTPTAKTHSTALGQNTASPLISCFSQQPIVQATLTPRSALMPTATPEATPVPTPTSTPMQISRPAKP